MAMVHVVMFSSFFGVFEAYMEFEGCRKMNELFVLRRNGDDTEGFKQQLTFYKLYGLSA